MRRTSLLTLIFLAAALTGCAKAGQDKTSSAQKTGSTEAAADAVDIDLTKMSANMVYAEVFNMLVEPEFYEGKTVRMKGTFYTPQDPQSSSPYACIVQDAAACCAAGLGFSLTDESAVTLPAENDIITVVGTYTCTEEDGFSTISLVNCTLES